MTGDDPKPPLIDRAHLDELRLVLGPQRVAELIESLLRELETIPALIASLDGAHRYEAAHRIRGPVLGMGFSRIAAILSEIEAGSGTVQKNCSALVTAVEQTRSAALQAPARRTTSSAESIPGK